MNDDDELLEVVDSEGRPIGTARRSRVHGDPSLIHRVVHVLVFNRQGKLLLQKRSSSKDVAPNKWDTSVGGHINPGEEDRAAATREMTEELGIPYAELEFLYRYLFSNHVESELVCTFSCVYEGPIEFNREEIQQVAFWDFGKIRESLGSGVFSRHFEEEIRRYLGRKD